MMTEDQREQLAIPWFQGAGWTFTNGTDLAPEGAAPERTYFQMVSFKARLAAAGRWLPKKPDGKIMHFSHSQAIPVPTDK